MKSIITIIVFITTFILSSSLVLAQQTEDVVYLKNGSVIRGSIIEQVPNESIKIKTKDGSIFAYKIDEIEKMTKEEIKGITESDNEDEGIFEKPKKPQKLGLSGFRKNKSYINVVIGYAWSGLSIGGGYEYAFSNMLSGGIDINYITFSEGTGQYSWDYTLIGGLAGISLHFSPGKKFDPFIKAGLGYFNWDAEYNAPSGSYSVTSGYSSGVGYAAQVGFNYFFSKSMGLKIVSGYPYYISGGITLKL